MHPNRYWLIFLALFAAVVFWKSGGALYRLYYYYSLNGHTEAKILHWSVVQKSTERFLLNAHYNFRVGEKEFEKDEQLDDPYLNAWAAEQTLKNKEKSLPVWYSSSNPLISTLQKNFPLRESLSAAILWILLIYFMGLGYYVASYGTDRSKKSDSR